jgi:hypothetical protein
MKTLIIRRKKVNLRGLARTLEQERYNRALANAAKPRFNDKFIHPRSRRQFLAQFDRDREDRQG